MQKKTISYLTILILLGGWLLVISSCCLNESDEHYTIPEEAESWIPYSPNDKVIFKNKSNKKDTFYVKHFEHKEFYAGETKCENDKYKERKKCVLENERGKTIRLDLDDFRIYIAVHVSRTINKYELYNGFAYNKQEFTALNDSNDRFFNSKVIQGTKYSNVLQLICNQGDSCAMIKELHYAKDTGLISFKDADDNRWFKK